MNYIVDFYCAELKLVVEIDGTSHLEKEDDDKKREANLMKLGLKIVRYNDLIVVYDFEKVEKDFKDQSVKELKKCE